MRRDSTGSIDSTGSRDSAGTDNSHFSSPGTKDSMSSLDIGRQKRPQMRSAAGRGLKALGAGKDTMDARHRAVAATNTPNGMPFLDDLHDETKGFDVKRVESMTDVVPKPKDTRPGIAWGAPPAHSQSQSPRPATPVKPLTRAQRMKRNLIVCLTKCSMCCRKPTQTTGNTAKVTPQEPAFDGPASSKSMG
jgi:hypothetical protein